MSIKTFSDFKNNFSLKNGEIGDQETLNRPTDRLKKEVDLISNFLKSSLSMPVDLWSTAIVYEAEAIVEYNNRIYMSVIDGNVSLTPGDSEGWMVQPKMDTINWNSKISYNTNDLVKASNGLLYISLINSNIALSPLENPTEWKEFSTTFANITASGMLTVEGVLQANENVTIGKNTINDNRKLTIITNDEYTSSTELYGKTNGSGKLYVGRDKDNGGGVEFYGSALNDVNIQTAGANYLALYNRFDGVWKWTARNSYINSDWEFAGSMDINNNLNVDGQEIFLGEAVQPNETHAVGMTTVRHHFTVNETATFNSDVNIIGAVGFVGDTDLTGNLDVVNSTFIHDNLTVDDNVTLNNIGGTTLIKGYTTIDDSLIVNHNITAHDNLIADDNVTLNNIGGTTTIKGATNIQNTLDVDSNLNVDGTGTIDQSVVLNNTSGTTTIKGTTTINSDVHLDNKLFMKKGSPSALVFEGTLTQNTGMEFQTDGVQEWLLYRNTAKDMILSAMNFDGLGTSKNAFTITNDTVEMTIPQQTHFNVGGKSPFTVASNVKVTNLNADLLDGLDQSQFVRSDANDTKTGTLTMNAQLIMGDAGYYSQELKFTNGTYTGGIDFAETGVMRFIDRNNNTSRIEMNLTASPGIKIAGNDVIHKGNSAVKLPTEINGFSGTGSYGSFLVDSKGTNGWEGYNIGGRSVFMHDNASTTGLYDDVNNKWFFRALSNGASYLYHNGAAVLQSTTDGIECSRLRSTVATGTAPLTVASTTKVTNLNADLLDGLDQSTFARYDHFRSLGTITLDTSSTTAGFISELEAMGAFNSYHTVAKCSWSYDGNSDLNTGIGIIELAGSVIECWTDNSNDSTRGNITVRVTRPNTGTGGATQWVYNDQGDTYSPGWRQLWSNAQVSDTVLTSKSSINALSFNATSDERKKKNIEVIKDSSSIINAIDGVRFDWKDENADQSKQAGVIAQTVESVFPEAVVTAENDDKSVNYNALVGLLIENAKEMQEQINTLKDEINLLKG